MKLSDYKKLRALCNGRSRTHRVADDIQVISVAPRASHNSLGQSTVAADVSYALHEGDDWKQYFRTYFDLGEALLEMGVKI